VSWFSFLLFVHVAMAVIWVGGGLMMQFFGLRAAMSGDPARAVAAGLMYWRYRVALAQGPPPAPASPS
jgi:hypothetical protein